MFCSRRRLRTLTNLINTWQVNQKKQAENAVSARFHEKKAVKTGAFGRFNQISIGERCFMENVGCICRLGHCEKASNGNILQ